MSTADIERFVADLKGNASLLDEAKGVSGGLAAMVTFADSKGYDITVDEAKAYVNTMTSSNLSDIELDAVAGGKGHHNVATQVVEVQMVATTTTEAAEVETTAAVASQAVAVAAIVLT